MTDDDTRHDTRQHTGRAGNAERRLLGTARVALLTVAVTIQFGVHGYRFFTVPVRGVEVAVYAALAVTGVGCALALYRQGRTSVLVRWAGVAALLACSAVMSAVLPLDPVDRAEYWSFSVIGWYALALLFDVRLGWVVAFLVTHALVSTAPVLVSGQSGTDLAAMAVVVVAVVGFQVGVALSALLVRAIAAAAARTAEAEERLRIREEEAAAAARNRKQRYADLRVTTIPLLAGFADGDLDPRDPAVRRRCAVEAARMRRLFSEREDVGDRLVHELGAAIDIAERHGASVHLSIRGPSGEVPQPVRRELLAPISEALVTARSEARVTVLRTVDHVRVSVRCEAPGQAVTRPGSDVEFTESVSNGQLWLETSWRSP